MRFVKILMTGLLLAAVSVPAAQAQTQRQTRVQMPRVSTIGVRLSVADVMGREVACLVDDDRPVGRHQALWNGRSGDVAAPAGVYFVRFDTPGRRFVKRLVLTR